MRRCGNRRSKATRPRPSVVLERAARRCPSCPRSVSTIAALLDENRDDIDILRYPRGLGKARVPPWPGVPSRPASDPEAFELGKMRLLGVPTVGRLDRHEARNRLVASKDEHRFAALDELQIFRE